MIYGLYIYIDPDEQLVDLMEIHDLDIEALCDLLRCDATDVVSLPNNLMGYVDGEGAWQGRQTAWELDDVSYWGPMLLFKGFNEDGLPNPCEADDLDELYDLIHFWD